MRNGLVEHLVGDLNADAIRTLHLDFFVDQSFQHLLTKDVRRRQFHARLGRTHDDQVLLAIELAFQHNALVDHCSDAVDELPGFG